jgi:hypothetical protein
MQLLKTLKRGKDMELGMATAPTWEIELDGTVAPILLFGENLADDPGTFQLTGSGTSIISEGGEPRVTFSVSEEGSRFLNLPLALQPFVVALLLVGGVRGVTVSERSLFLSCENGLLPQNVYEEVNLLVAQAWDRDHFPDSEVDDSDTDERGEDDWPDVIG